MSTQSNYRLYRLGLVLALYLSLGVEGFLAQADEIEPAAVASSSLLYKDPVSVAVSADGRFMASVNRGGNSLSLISLADHKVFSELALEAEPRDVVFLDDLRLAISTAKGLTLAETDAQGAWSVKTFSALGPVADLAAREDRIYVALPEQDSVAAIDLKNRSLQVARVKVGALPRRLTLSPDGRYLCVCCELPGELWVLDAQTLQTQSRRELLVDAFNLGRPAITPDGNWCIVPYMTNRPFPVNKGNLGRGWVVNNRLARLRLPSAAPLLQERMGLDRPGRGMADLAAASISPDGRWLAVAAAGTHEVAIIDYAKLNWPSGDPDDFAPNRLYAEPNLCRVVPVGGRPLALAWGSESELIVANSLQSRLQFISTDSAKIEHEILLSLTTLPQEKSLARRGEEIFHDADRSFERWLSCHTCHPEGATNGQTFDTTNDGGYDDYKLTPSLRTVAKTPPWTWHGWQADLRAAMKKSLEETMSGPTASAGDAEALVAYLTTLTETELAKQQQSEVDTAVSDPAVSRGKELFQGAAGCNACHAQPYFTTADTFQVAFRQTGKPYPGLNPPSLLGVSERRRFLNDGRARNLEDVLRYYHTPRKTSGADLSDEQINDLIAYLKTL